MCSRIGAAVLAVVVTAPAWGVGAPLAAQGREQELTTRIDSLLPILKTARRRAARADSAARARALERTARVTEELRVGPLRVVARKDQVELARRVMGNTWSYFAAFVDHGERLFRDEVFTFQVVRGRVPDLEVVREGGYGVQIRDGGRAAIRVEASADRTHRVEIRALYGRDALREKAGSLVAGVLNRGLDEELLEWGRIEPPSAIRGEGWLYRELAVSSSIPVRRCFAGEEASCWEAAGMVDPSAGTGDPDPPLSYPARSALLAFALRTGGRGAYARLMESRGDPRERLAAAAETTPDALMAAWLARVRRARPDPQGGRGRSAAAALAWLALFGFLAAGSTRWRST